MTPSTPDTPAPLSFDSPQVQAAIAYADSVGTPSRVAYGQVLADALTHEHEARVRAEAGRAEGERQFQAKVEEVIFQMDRAEQAEAERDRALNRANELLADRTKLSNVLAWIRRRVDPAKKHDTHTTLSMLLRKLDENGIEEKQPSAGALGEREAGK